MIGLKTAAFADLETRALKAREMTAPRIVIRFFTACLVAGCTTAYASSTGTYPLDWPHAGEVLSYRSCGCADACWVAEVRDRRTGALKARLRCDCESLHYARSSNSSKETALGNCESINGSGSKPEAIREKLEQLLHLSTTP